MILPKNGRIVILDDKIEQAYPIIKALSKQKISFCYHTDELELLPPENEPYPDLRLLLLDINLSADGTPIETIKAQLQQTLKRIIKPWTPYIAAIWSLKENQYDEMLTELFDKIIPELKPIQRVSLAKSEFFILGDVQDGLTVYIEDPEIDIVAKLNEKIIQALSSIDSLEALIKWENIVGDSASEIVNEVFQLAQFKKEDVNLSLKKIYFNLAYAFWGRQLLKTPINEMIKKSLSTLNSLLNDKIENEVQNKLQIEFLREEKFNPSIDIITKSSLNTKLLLSFDQLKEIVPGNIYDANGEKGIKYQIVQDIIDDSTFYQEYCDFSGIKMVDLVESNGLIKLDFVEKFQVFRNQKINQLTDLSSGFIMELTPVCDFSQKKYVNNRIISGIILNIEFVNHLKRTADFFYKSPELFMFGKVYVLIFDFRYIRGLDFGKIKHTAFICRLRHLFLNEIQHNLARQISRPGLVYIQ